VWAHQIRWQAVSLIVLVIRAVTNPVRMAVLTAGVTTGGRGASQDAPCDRFLSTSFQSALHRDANALAQRDLVFRPVLDRSSIGDHGHGVIIQAGEVFDEVVACGVPNVDPEGEIGVGLHGQARLDSPAPHPYLYPSCVATGELWQPNELDDVNAALGQRQTCES
jgi:hypothetical protein